MLTQDELFDFLNRLIPATRFRPDGSRKHLFQKNLVLVRVTRYRTTTDKNTTLESQLINVVFGIPIVSDFIKDGFGNIFFT